MTRLIRGFYFICPTLICLFSAEPAKAQIKVNSQLAHAAYVQYEPLIVTSSVENETGKPLVFNLKPDDPQFYFIVRDEFGYELTALTGNHRTHPDMIPARSRGTVTNNLLHHFNLSKPGYYSVQAAINWLGKSYTGEKTHFEVIKGLEVIRTTGEVPEDGSMRTFSIIHVNRLRQDHILLRMDDEDQNLCYGVLPLGRAVINVKPQLAVDIQGNVHVLFKPSPGIYSHAIYTPFGVPVSMEEFGQEYSVVNLKSLPSGKIEASGRPADKTTPTMMKSTLGN